MYLKYTTVMGCVSFLKNWKSISNKLSLIAFAILATGMSSSANGQIAILNCPPDAVLECGQNVNDLSLTGTPVLDLLVGASANITHSDAIITSGDCATIIARTWTAELEELGGSLGSVTCTQIISVLDTQGPVISGIENGITVSCIDELPAFSDASASDVCSGETSVSAFQSSLGNEYTRCTLSTAFGPGADWALWLPTLAEDGETAGANFVFGSAGGVFEQYSDGTAHITGTLVNTLNPAQQFVANLWLKNRRNWTDWSSLGRDYKNDLNLACATNSHEGWDYYELADGFSTLTGAGELAGDILYLNHQPVNYYFGFQVGTGANNKNCNSGISGWFSYNGFLGSQAVSGNGDINCDSQCSPELTECPNRTTVTRLYRAIDACGRATVETQVIEVNDQIAPVFTNCPQDITIECNDDVPAVASNLTATDNCSGTVTVAFEGETESGSLCSRTITRTWSAEDACGNRSSCVQSIYILDTQAPVLIGLPSQEITAECDNIPAASTVTATDNCDESVTVSFNETTTQGECPGQYTITRTWSSMDDCENYSEFTQTISVEDTTAPVFDAYDVYISIECTEQPTIPTATDNCGIATVTEQSEVLNSGGCLGVLTVVYRATDDCGNYSEITQFISILDTTAPTLLNIPAETTVECNTVAMNESGEYFGQGDVTGTDNCGYDVVISYNEVVVPTNDDCDASYDIIRTWTATDYCENESSATQTVHVIDSTAPVLTIPADYTIECDQEVSFEAATATDNCSAYTISETVDTINGNCASNYTITRTFVATDACGNVSASLVQQIQVQDSTAPVFSEGQQSEYTYECGSEIPVIEPSASDNCASEISVTYSDSEAQGNSCSNLTTRTWTATDECNNSSVFVQYINVVDTTAPVIAGANTTERPCDDYAGNYVTASDICSEYTITYDDEFVSGGCAGNIIRTYTATDACGNASAPFIQIISLQDISAPSIVSQTQNFSVECDDEYSVTPPVFADNCDNELEITSDVASSTDEANCTTVVTYTWTAIDNCDNEVTATTVVTISDLTNPVFGPFETEITISCDEAIPALVIPTVTDNCDTDVDVSVSEDALPGNCPQEYTIYRVFRAIDNCGNQAVETQVINVVDETAPVFSEENTTQFTYECSSTIPVIEPVASDNCSEVITFNYTDSAVDGTSCNSQFVRTWFATDECGNTSTFAQTINLVDTTAPVITAEIQISLPCDQVAGIYATATDNCSEYTITYTDVYVSGSCAGTIIRSYVATDICGNESAPFTQFISLTDEVAPVAVVPFSTLSVSCDEELPSFNPEFTDNCSDDLQITFMTDSIVPGNCPASYTVIRRAMAMDECDNTAIATQTIVVTDSAAPIWEEQGSSFTYECGSEAPVVTPVANDNCSTISYSYTDGTTEIIECVSRFSRNWIATDACGNVSSVFSQLIQFEDTTEPVLSGCPSDEVLACDQTLPSPATVTVTDACDDNVTVDYQEFYFGDVPTPGSISDCDLMTPSHASGGNCGVAIAGNDIDWAMQLMGLPSMHRYYRVTEGDLVRFENSIVINATLVNVLDATSGFNVQVTFDGGYDWAAWSSLPFPTGFKADCGGEEENYESWLYYILQDGEGAELTGFGAYAGSLINLSHAPANNYFGFQYGNGANNYNGSDEAFGGWFSYNGLFQYGASNQPTTINGAGDFAFDLDCCPDYYVVRQWTASDCSGNTTSCTQTITYEGTTPATDGSVSGNGAITEATVEGKISDISVYPNPARSTATFTFKAAKSGKTTLEVIDLSGRKVADVYYGVVDAGSEYIVLFDTEVLATGIYMYRFTNGEEVQMKKLIVNKQT